MNRDKEPNSFYFVQREWEIHTDIVTPKNKGV